MTNIIILLWRYALVRQFPGAKVVLEQKMNCKKIITYLVIYIAYLTSSHLAYEECTIALGGGIIIKHMLTVEVCSSE